MLTALLLVWPPAVGLAQVGEERSSEFYADVRLRAEAVDGLPGGRER